MAWGPAVGPAVGPAAWAGHASRADVPWAGFRSMLRCGGGRFYVSECGTGADARRAGIAAEERDGRAEVYVSERGTGATRDGGGGVDPEDIGCGYIGNTVNISVKR